MSSNECCRGCFELTDLLSIFSDYGSGRIVDLIEYCVGIKILENDPIQLICNNCLEKLEVAEEIKRKFLEADAQLKTINIKQEEEEEEDLTHQFEEYVSYEQTLQEDLKLEENEEAVKSEDHTNFVWPSDDSKKLKKAKRKSDEKTGIKTTRCQICKIQCHSRAELREHNMEVHSKILTCEMCNQQMTSKDTFRKHMRQHIANT